MSVYVNRTLNMKKIKAIGFDMDYTLVRYYTEAFERFTYEIVKSKLIQVKKYPKILETLEFDFELTIQGLVIDKQRGNLLKVSRYGKVKQARFGTEELAFSKMQQIYRNRVIDLGDSTIQSLDTSFSISNGVLYAQLVQLKKEGHDIPDYHVLATDIREAIDIAHSDNSLKGEVAKDLEKFIIQEPELASMLERFKDAGKKLLLITNSDFTYSKLLLDFTINPHLKAHKSWEELFDITVTLSRKPLFFTSSNPFLKVDPNSAQMSNTFGKLDNGVYQGGWAGKLQDDLGLEGDQILYLGDHIYGDVVSIKKTFNWRTALVLEPLAEETKALSESSITQGKIDDLMKAKELLEVDLCELEIKKYKEPGSVAKEDINPIYAKMDKINDEISTLIDDYRTHFNPYWGEMMRAGQEESRFADQVEKYACIYMSKVTDLLAHSARTYFRPEKRSLPHEG